MTEWRLGEKRNIFEYINRLSNYLYWKVRLGKITSDEADVAIELASRTLGNYRDKDIDEWLQGDAGLETPEGDPYEPPFFKDIMVKMRDPVVWAEYVHDQESDFSDMQQAQAKERATTQKQWQEYVKFQKGKTDLAREFSRKQQLAGKGEVPREEAFQKALGFRYALPVMAQQQQQEGIKQWQARQAQEMFDQLPPQQIEEWAPLLEAQRQWEEGRSRELERLDQPEDFIKRWQVGQMTSGIPGSRPTRSTAAGPGAPDWLAKVVGAKTLTPQTRVPIPSAQQWGRWSPTQRAQFQGFADFAGSAQNVYEEIRKRLPQPRPGSRTATFRGRR